MMNGTVEKKAQDLLDVLIHSMDNLTPKKSSAMLKRKTVHWWSPVLSWLNKITISGGYFNDREDIEKYRNVKASIMQLNAQNSCLKIRLKKRKNLHRRNCVR